MTMDKFYMAVVQAVLLYEANSWVISTRNWQKLKDFHHRVLRYMTGRKITNNQDRTWHYPHHKDLQWHYSLFDTGTYAKRQRGIL